VCFENICNIVHLAHRRENFRAAFSIQKVFCCVFQNSALEDGWHEEDKQIAIFTKENTERQLEARKLDGLIV
jgi:hypothetical protein